MILNWISTWPGEPKPHAWGSTSLSPMLLFPFLLQSMDTGYPPRLQSPTTLHPYVRTKIKPTSTRRVYQRSTCWSDQVLKLTDYHISRYVTSTFKRLTRWATHRDLNHFLLHQRGITTTKPCPLSLYFSRNLESVKSYVLARGRKPLDFYRSWLAGQLVDKMIWISNIGT